MDSWLIVPERRIYESLSWVPIGPGNGVSPMRPQAIVWTNDNVLLIRNEEQKFESQYNDFQQENAFENVFHNIAIILSRTQFI